MEEKKTSQLEKLIESNNYWQYPRKALSDCLQRCLHGFCMILHMRLSMETFCQ